jgi:hypothetical protein
MCGAGLVCWQASPFQRDLAMKKSKKFDEIKAMVPDLPQGAIEIYKGQLYIMKGKDLTYMPSMKPFQTALKSDYPSFIAMLNNPVNHPERLELNKALIALAETIIVFKRSCMD